jgi:hypothetical protein
MCLGSFGSAQYPGPFNALRPDWKKHQGPPSVHFALAKQNGYDFYLTSDHSQEAGLQPPGPTNPKWMAIKREAAEATTATFVGIAGYEHSENDDPGGVGHINVFNTDSYLNAVAPGVDLPYRVRNGLCRSSMRRYAGGQLHAFRNSRSSEQWRDWIIVSRTNAGLSR